MTSEITIRSLEELLEALPSLPRKEYGREDFKGAPAKHGGLWLHSGGNYLDTSSSEVQRFALELMCNNLTWNSAMNFGGSQDSECSFALIRPDRAFNSSRAVDKAARAGAKALGVSPTYWKEARKPQGPALPEAVEVAVEVEEVEAA